MAKPEMAVVQWCEKWSGRGDAFDRQIRARVEEWTKKVRWVNGDKREMRGFILTRIKKEKNATRHAQVVA